MIRRTIAIAVLPILACASAGRAQDGEFGRLASYVSRDALLFVQLRDAKGFVRRIAHTAIGRSVESISAEDLNETALEALSELSIFVPHDALASFGAILSRIDGEAVLAVEGVSSVDGAAVPDILAIVEKRERVDQLVKLAVRAASGDQDAIDDLDDLDLPFQVDTGSGAVGISTYADATMFVLRTDEGQRIPIAVTPKLVLAASNEVVLKRALDRGGAAAFGSLVDSLRFRESVRSVDTGSGSLLAYLNLRRVRHEGALLIGRVSWPRQLYGELLEEYDGVCLSLRGENDALHARIEFEQGRVSGAQSLGSSNETLRYPRAVPSSSFVSAMQTAPRPLVNALRFGLYLAGNLAADQAIDQFVARCGGTLPFERMMSAFGGETDFFLIGEASESDPYPRLGMRIELRDRTALLRSLEALVANSDGRVRSAQFGDEPMFIAELAGANYRSQCALLVRQNEAFLVPNPALLKVLVAAEQSEPRFIDHDPLLAACDRLDIDPLTPSSAHYFVDLRALSEIAPSWVHPLWAVGNHESGGSRFLIELFHAIQDPEFSVGLSSLFIRAQATPSGLRLDFVGP